MKTFIANYDAIARRYVERLEASSTTAFWQPFFADAPFELRIATARPAVRDLERRKTQNIVAARKSRVKQRNRRVASYLRNAVLLGTNSGIPDGFDESVYLRLNPDVRDAGISARKHFILHGKRENRNWKENISGD